MKPFSPFSLSPFSLLLSSLLLFSFFLSPFPVFSQPKINTITWVGPDDEYLNISKKMAIFQVDTLFYEFNVAKYVKNKYITFSCLTSYGVELKQKYHIVNFTKDTLILVPDGEDIFELCEPNKRGQSVFVNSMLTYKFVKLHYEVSSDIVEFGYEIEPNRLKSISTLDIDSTRKVKIVIKDEYSNEPRIYKSLVSKKEYEHLIKILSSVNLDSYPDEKINKNAKRYSVLVIQYNDQKKIFKGSTPFFYSKLRDFIWEYIALINGGDVIKVRR